MHTRSTMVKLRSRADRIRAAILMYNGIGRDRRMEVVEIAEALDVTPRTVKGYLDDNPIANGMRADLADVAEQESRMIVQDLQERMSKLRALEEELMDAVEVVVTEYEERDIEGDLTEYKAENYTLESSTPVEQTISLPSEVKQVPQFDRLQAVWEEQRKTQEQLTKLLGLNEPDKVQLQGDITERKIWGLTEAEDTLPDQEVQSVDDVSEDGYENSKKSSE